MLAETTSSSPKYFLITACRSSFFETAGVYLQKHTSFMLKSTINNVMTSVSAIIIVVVIIITSAGGGA